MSELGKLLRELRGKRSLREIAEITELSHTYISDIEKGYRRGTNKAIHPSPETLKRLAEAYYYPYEKLMKAAGYLEAEVSSIDAVADTETTYKVQLTEKDESDIAKRMDKIRKDLIEGNGDEDSGLSFRGEPMSDEAIESLLEALEHAERIATLANKKYIPKKYRKE